MEDSYKHKGLRQKLVEVVKAKGIRDEAVLQAVGELPRHHFMDNAFLKFAYEDKAFPIGAGQTISQPYTVAFQTELLQVQYRHKVLEIGTGSGYQTAILLKLGAKVFTIERQRPLYDKTRFLLPKLGFNPRFFYGDGYKGQPAYAPFDRIIVTAGAPYVPEDLKQQLKVGGRMVIPVGNESQTMLLIERLTDTEFVQTEHGAFKFVPLLEDRE